jgi:hypothetical protein
LIERGVCYEKNISYYCTYKLNIIADKMKNINKNTTLSEIAQNLIEKYHTVGNSSKSNRKIPHCRNSSKSNRKIPHCRNSSKSNRKIVERDKSIQLTHNIQIYDRSLEP